MPHVGAVVFRFASIGGAFTLLFISMATVAALAQDKPIAEFTGSYQFERLTLSAGGASGSANFSRGWDGSVNVPITRWFGVVGDVGRVWKTETASVGTVSASATLSVYTYGGGPQLTFRSPHVSPFARFILGEAHSSLFASVAGASAGASVNSFFIAPGCGADFRIVRNIWLRAGADYLHTNKYGVAVNGVRAFGGITFIFGRRGEAPARDQTASAPHATGAGMRIDALGIMATLGHSTGAEITDEAPNGVAALAGLHPGDVINAVDGKPMKTPMELAAELANRPAGDKVRLGYLLHGSWQTETVVLLRH